MLELVTLIAGAGLQTEQWNLVELSAYVTVILVKLQALVAMIVGRNSVDLFE